MNDAASIADSWAQLVRSAIVGTQRSRPATLERGAQWGALLAPAGDSDEAAVLRAAAILGLLRRAGRRTERPAAGSPAVAEPEILRRCAPVAAADLARIVEREREPALLAQWLAVARDAGVRVAEEQLPLLLTYAAPCPELHAAVAAVAGARGAWLARQRSEWSFAGGPNDAAAQHWLHGDRAARVAAFIALRRSDPHAARDRLVATWEREPANERVAFLRGLQTGLSAADEPFLEARLDERLTEIRTAAAAVLARLPTSQFAARAVAAARASIAIRKRVLQSPVLEVTLPETPTDAMRRDGIDGKPPPGLGRRSWLLREIVARVPPAQLCGDLAPAQFLELARTSDHAVALLSGLATATASYSDDAMRVAWLAATCNDFQLRDFTWTANLGASWSDARRDAIAAIMRHDAPRAADFALTLPGPWDQRFSRAFLAYARVATGNGADRSFWRDRKELFAAAALRLDPALADAHDAWPANIKDENAGAVIDSFYETVCFRAAMRRNVESRT